MKKGIEFAHSNEKRVLDLALANGARPAEFMVRMLARLRYASKDVPRGIEVFTKIGQNEIQFEVEKLRALDAQLNPVDAFAGWLEKLGVDELPQLKAVRAGQMSIFGHRGILPEEYVEFMDTFDPKLGQKHQSIVMPTRSGIISSYGVLFHEGVDQTENQANIRAEMNIKDVMDDSLVHEIAFLGSVMLSAARGFEASERT